ncbi:hypothetical protein F5Y02DRAFT_389792 [Annulohypoxylon stygium]|nr:hypothetical protein F5Y02DRAFT_389792 [Annulohypoxylon stygium]
MHLLDHGRLGLSQFDSTIKLFSQLLSVLSHVVVIFVDDFPSLSSVIELLACWIRSSHQDLHCRPRLLLVSEAFNHKVDNRTRLLDRLLRYLTRVQHTTDPTQVHTNSHSEDMCWRCFESLQLFPGNSETANVILQHGEEILDRRRTLGWAFSASDLRRIVHSAIANFSKSQPKKLDLISVIRSCDSQKDFNAHIRELVKITKRDQNADLARIIASALHADAYPKRGHRFFADSIYKATYHEQLRSLFRKLGLEPLENQVEKAFYEIARQTASTQTTKSSLEYHLIFLKKLGPFFENKFSVSSCFTCLAMPSCAMLTCGHTICERCTRSISHVEQDNPCHFEIPRCPLCQGVNTRVIFLRPPTASKRVLILEAPMQSKMLLGHFFKDLCSFVSLNGMPLRNHFDVVYAKEAGAYYALAMYLGGRNISQCIEGSKDIRDIRVTGGFLGQTKRMDFGANQRWTVKEICSYAGTSINVQHKGSCYSNHVTYVNTSIPSQGAQASNSPRDVTIRYHGNTFDSVYLQAAADQIIGALFYIELTELPRLYSAPARCKIRLICSVPPGPACASLQKRLRGAEVRYREDKGRYKGCRLQVGMRNNERLPPTTFEVTVTSLDSTIEVNINKGSSEMVVSKPYQLKHLIMDQGIDNPWHPNYRPETGSTPVIGEWHLNNELSALYKTMNQVAGSGFPSRYI